MGIIVLVAAAVLAVRWGKRRDWTIRHEWALTAGSLLTCSWCGFVVTFMYRADDPLAWTGNGLFAVTAVLLLAAAARRINRHASLQ